MKKMKKCKLCKRPFPEPVGRPKKLNDQSVKALHKAKFSIIRIAEHFRVTRGAIYASLRRSENETYD